jgi:hypothetical protein
MAKRFLILIFIFLMTINFTGAVPPITQIPNLATGYSVEVPIVDYIKTFHDFNFKTHVYNLTNGVPVTNKTTSCTLHVYNSTGRHLIEQNMIFDPNDFDWGLTVNGANFSYNGQYAGIVWCNSTSYGGYTEWSFYANSIGSELTESKSIFYISLIGIFIFFFTLIIFFMGKLPDGETRNEDGDLISISNLKYFKSVLVFVDWMILIAIFYVTSNLAFAYLSEQMFAKILFRIYQICFSLTIPIVVIWFIWIFVSLFQDKKMKRLIEKGIYPRGNI